MKVTFNPSISNNRQIKSKRQNPTFGRVTVDAIVLDGVNKFNWGAILRNFQEEIMFHPNKLVDKRSIKVAYDAGNDGCKRMIREDVAPMCNMTLEELIS